MLIILVHTFIDLPPPTHISSLCDGEQCHQWEGNEKAERQGRQSSSKPMVLQVLAH